MIEPRFYQYVASEMILGKRNLSLKDLTVYRLDIFKDLYKGLNMSETTSLGIDGRMATVRAISFSDQTGLQTSHINISNEVARIVTYKNKDECIQISDTLFKDDAFKIYTVDMPITVFTEAVEAKIGKLALLIKALNETCIDDIPMIINDFPYIAQVLFDKSGILVKT